MVATQRIQVGLIHTRKVVTVTAEDDLTSGTCAGDTRDRVRQPVELRALLPRSLPLTLQLTA
jgi:hypothetical protein